MALRQRNLNAEVESLDKDDNKRKKNEKANAGTTTATGKRKRDDTNKTKKENAKQTKIAKLKTSASNSPAHSLHTDDSMDAVPCGLTGNQTPQDGGKSDQPATKIIVPKNDIPNKFWLSVEPYCMPLTQEDIKVIYICFCMILDLINVSGSKTIGKLVCLHIRNYFLNVPQCTF